MRWARVGSNHRPRDYESPALTTELRALGVPSGARARCRPLEGRAEGSARGSPDPTGSGATDVAPLPSSNTQPGWSPGSGGEVRTRSLGINSALLRQLSYPGSICFGDGRVAEPGSEPGNDSRASTSPITRRCSRIDVTHTAGTTHRVLRSADRWVRHRPVRRTESVDRDARQSATRTRSPRRGPSPRWRYSRSRIDGRVDPEASCASTRRRAGSSVDRSSRIEPRPASCSLRRRRGRCPRPSGLDR